MVKGVLGGDARFLSLAVGLTVEDELVGGGLEPVDRALGEERVGHQSEPFDRFTVGGDHGRGGAVAFDDQLVDVGGVECLEREVVDDEQVDAEQFAHLGVVAVVEWLERSRLRSRSQRSKWTLNRRRTAAWPSAVARNVLPTPTGPRMNALRAWSMNRIDTSSLHTARS